MSLNHSAKPERWSREDLPTYRIVQAKLESIGPVPSKNTDGTP